MSYPSITHLGPPAVQGGPSGPDPGSQEAEEAMRNLLNNLGSRKEFYSLRYRRPVPLQPGVAGYRASLVTGTRGRASDAFPLVIPGFSLHGAQLFVRNFMNPNTPYTRILVDWQTGTGKSIAVIGLSHEFVRQFRLAAAAKSGLRESSRTASLTGEPTVFIIGFTRSIIMEDMLKYPELGFISAAEIEERRRLRIAAELAGPSSPEARHLSGFNGVLRRRITDRTRGGFFQFYGYKEFANRLFQVTRRGAAQGFDVQALYERSLKAADEGPSFGERLAQEVRRGNVVVNTELVESMRGGLLISDEIHNVYNMQAKNNYGVAIQYVLDVLDDEAPRAAFMSATPLSGSAEEIVDVGNLVIPRSALPGGVALRRSDFFASRRATGGAADLAARWDEGPITGPDDEPIAVPGDGDIDDDMAISYITPESVNWGHEPENLDEADIRTAMAASDIIDASTLVSEGMAALSDVGFTAEATEEADEEIDVPVSQLLPGALEKIGHLMAGRVSFLLDTDVTAYPRKVLVGEPIPSIAYLKFVQCPMSLLHERTLDKALEIPAIDGESSERVTFRRAIPANAATLYDMVYPNPEYPVEKLESGDALGLYISGETPAKLAAAPQPWRDTVGVAVLKGAETGLPAGTPLVTGPFLRLPTLKAYSGKYAELAARVIENIRQGPGKIMIYHHRVRMSGILQIQEALRMNGFIDEVSNPTSTTLCSICGVERDKHGAAPHKYLPARFVSVHSDIDRAAMERNINRFNAPANLNGDLIRVLLGSKIIREGANMKAVNYQYVTALPTDIPTLIQVMGRVVRKDSHAELPAERQFVQIAILVSVRREGGQAPETRRYMEKMREYLVIQEIDRAIRRYAVDGFANYGRLTSADASLAERATLESLPYRPVVASIDSPITLATFEAFGHADREIRTIVSILRVLFRARPVWKYDDLWDTVRKDTVRGVGYDPAMFSEGNFALALQECSRPWGNPPVGVVHAAPFFILAPAGKAGKPVADIESYARAPSGGVTHAPPAVVRIRVKDFLQGKGEDKRFAALLRDLEVQYLRPSAPSSLNSLLIDVGSSAHYSLLKRIVEGAAGIIIFEPFKTFLDKYGPALTGLYTRFRVIITADNILKSPDAVSVYKGTPQQLQALPPDTPLGFVTPRTVRIFAQTASGSEWQDIPHVALGIGKRFRENDAIVGFIDTEQPAGTTFVKFKVRKGLHRLRELGARDARSLSRGAVCETRPRDELAAALMTLFTMKNARQKPVVKTAQDICRLLKDTLLELELASRSLPSGMMDSLRFCYLPFDRQPSLSAALGTQRE